MTMQLDQDALEAAWTLIRGRPAGASDGNTYIVEPTTHNRFVEAIQAYLATANKLLGPRKHAVTDEMIDAALTAKDALVLKQGDNCYEPFEQHVSMRAAITAALQVMEALT
jgi:hypothetical protein